MWQGTKYTEFGREFRSQLTLAKIQTKYWPMAVFNMHQAKTELSRLVALAEAGEEVVIARHNIAVARLVPVRAPPGKGGETDAASGFGEEAQMGLADTENIASKAGAAPLTPELDPWEHAPDDYITKEAIAAFYRKYPNEWNDMRQRVGANAGPVNKGKPRVPGRFAHLAANLPPDLFTEPLDEDELAAWEGKYSDPSTP
jgi:antitoxin (DNA-binding transcriptional repressor) of toxin-antitoxin stability system